MVHSEWWVKRAFANQVVLFLHAEGFGSLHNPVSLDPGIKWVTNRVLERRTCEDVGLLLEVIFFDGLFGSEGRSDGEVAVLPFAKALVLERC